MRANKPAYRTGLGLLVIAFLGLVAGLFLWPHISLPFSNPLNIVGPLAVQHYNPLNNIIRFGLVLILPSLCLLAAILLFKPFWRSVAAREEPVLSVSQRDSRQGLYLAALIVTAALFVVGTANNNPLDTFHEGETLGMAACYESGMVPYRDFLFVHGLYQDPLRTVVAFDVFGRSIASVRTLDTIHRILFAGMLVVLLLSMYRGNTQNALLALLFLFFAIMSLDVAFKLSSEPYYSVFSTSFPSRDMTTLAFVLLFFVLHRQSSSGTKNSLLAAAFVFSLLPGLAFVYSIDRGFYLSLAWLVAVPLLAGVVIRQSAKRTVFLAGATIGMIAGISVLIALLGEGTAAFFRFVFLEMPRYKELFDGYVYPVSKLAFALPIVIFAVLLFWFTVRAVHYFNREGRIATRLIDFLRTYSIELFLFVLALLFFRSALGRAEWGHLGYSLLPLLLLLSWIALNRGVPRLVARFSRSRTLLSYGAFAGAILFWLGAGTQIAGGGLLAHVFPLGRPDTAYLPKEYIVAAPLIQNHLQPGETFATLTSEAVWYYLIDRPCPVRFPIVWFAAPVPYQQQMIDELERKQVTYLLYRNGHWANRMDDMDNATRLPVLMSYVDSHYAYDTTIAGQELWKRKN